MKEKKISIIVPFKRLNGYVLECIRHCRSLLYNDFEIILLPDHPVALPPGYDAENIRVVASGDVTI